SRPHRLADAARRRLRRPRQPAYRDREGDAGRKLHACARPPLRRGNRELRHQHRSRRSRRRMRAAAASIAVVLGASAPFTTFDDSKASELAEAAERGDRARVEAILETAGARERINAAAGYGMTALHFAVLSNDLELAEILLDAGADPNLGNAYEITPLWL